MFDGKDDLKADYRRVEVLTGPGRRPRWSVEDKARIVAEAMTPGAVMSEVARQWQLSSQQVFGWRREARAGLLALPADGAVASLPVPDFVPILAEPAVSASAPEATSVPAIGVEIAGAVVRVRPGMDEALLTSVLHAMLRDDAINHGVGQAFQVAAQELVESLSTPARLFSAGTILDINRTGFLVTVHHAGPDLWPMLQTANMTSNAAI